MAGGKHVDQEKKEHGRSLQGTEKKGFFTRTAAVLAWPFIRFSQAIDRALPARFKPGRLLLNAGIARQLIVPFVTTILVVGVIGVSISYYYGSKLTREQLTQSTLAQLRDVNANFETYFSDAESVVRQFTESEKIKNGAWNEKEIRSAFQDVISTNKKYEAMMLATTNKQAVRAPLYYFEPDYDPTREDWYKLAANGAGKSVWTNPYVDTVRKENVVSVAQAVTSSRNVVRGAVKLDLFLSTLTSQVKNSKFGKSGYAVLLDPEGTYIAAPENGLIGKNISDQSFYRTMEKKGKSGMFSAEIDGTEKLICFVTNETTGWRLLGVIDASEFSGQANLIALPSIVTVAVILIVAILLTVYLIRRITSRIGRLQEAAGRVASGDLTVAIPVEGKDELAGLTAAINRMSEANRAAFIQINAVSQKIADASQTLVASSEENTASANEISATVNQIAVGAADQTKALDENQSALQTLVEETARMDSASRELLNRAKEMTDTSHAGNEAMEHLHEQSSVSEETTGQIVRKVKMLEQQAEQASQVIDVIGSISRKTNLLSLNASIEAAHAGEQGKGFAVVAREIRQLAGQTRRSTEKVTEHVNAMNEEMAAAVQMAEETRSAMEAQNQAVEQTRQAFREIERAIATNVEGIRSIVSSIGHARADIDRINKGSETIASTSEETAASTEEVSASVEEQTAAMEELNKLATDLDEQVRVMEKAIGRFKI